VSQRATVFDAPIWRQVEQVAIDKVIENLCDNLFAINFAKASHSLYHRPTDFVYLVHRFNLLVIPA
jgi:hypothetical protein